jgi:FixJ family two-component response regulator
MTNEPISSQHRRPLEGFGVSLVDGDAEVRHARQIMLRSEAYDVRSYATCAALLADDRSRDYPCIIVDVEMEAGDGMSLLREMRATGWHGKAILLDGDDPGSELLQDIERHGDTILDRRIGDRSLIAAIEATVDRGWSGWNPAD